MRVFDQIGARVVDPHTHETPAPSVPQLASDAGKIWGKASAFSYQFDLPFGGTPPDDGDRMSVVGDLENATPEYKRIINGNAAITSREVRVSEGGDLNATSYVDVSRMHRLEFSFTEYPPKPWPPATQPSFTTYYHLTFDLHPTENETEL